MCRACALCRAAGGSEAAIIAKNSGMIDRNAHRLVKKIGRSSLFDDLWSVGALALLEAHKRYDESSGVRFESFAWHRIKGAMVDELREIDHLPRRMRIKADKVILTEQKLEHELGRLPFLEETATALKMSIEEIEELKIAAQPSAPIELSPQIAEVALLPDAQIAEKEASRALAAARGMLPERLQLLITSHYEDGVSISKIAKALKISEPRASQLHLQALRRMRNALAGQG